MPLDNYRARVNSCLSSHFSQKGALTENMRYSVLAGGKRFRPILTYTTASVFNVDLAQADSCACAVELIHIYSLIHDDLPAMDDDDMRHNQPANHKQRSEEHTSELQSQAYLVCRLLLEKKNKVFSPPI